MKEGDKVRFKEVIDDGDEETVMTVIEMRGDRVLVEEHGTGMHITPTSVYPISDLVPA